MENIIDICILSYNRKDFTRMCLEEIAARTKHPHRVIVVDNGSTDGTAEWLKEKESGSLIDDLVLNPENWGVHGGWNLALEQVTSELMVSTDNDIIPQPGWLCLLVDLMERFPEYGAVCLRAQAFIGQGGDLFKDSPEIKPRSHIPAYGRIMRTSITKEMGGWRNTKKSGRNNEDWTVGRRMKKAGYKVGFSRDIRCIHLWGDEDSHWGYPIGEEVGHREIWPPTYKSNWDLKGFDWNTCAPKKEMEAVEDRLRALGYME